MRKVLGALVLLAAAGAGWFLYQGRELPIDRKPQPRRNPTSYLFKSGASETAAVIRKSFGKGEWRGMSLVPTGTPGFEVDLTRFHDPIGKSTVYSVRGEPADYLADFRIEITEINPMETEVVVRTKLSEIIAGKKFGVGSCGPGFANRYVKVEPTTIEEYEILLRIGAELGEKGMPALVLP